MNSNKMDMVRLVDLEDYERLPRTKWNIKQPSEDEVREEALESEAGLDLVLVPGLAFSGRGERCGRGRGYYDTYLARAAAAQGRAPATVALAFRQQLVAEVPTDPHDFTVDIVLCSDQEQ